MRKLETNAYVDILDEDLESQTDAHLISCSCSCKKDSGCANVLQSEVMAVKDVGNRNNYSCFLACLESFLACIGISRSFATG